MTDKDKPFNHILIIGCGDIGERVAKIWQNNGKTVYGAVRRKEQRDRLEQLNIIPCPIDLDNLSSLKNLPSKNALLYYFAPPPAMGQQDTRMENFLKNLDAENAPGSHKPRQIIYISTSGVYGDQQGQLINEQTPVKPQVDRAKRRYHAEQQLHQWSAGSNIPVTILRVGGIYGPGRLPLQRLKDQIPMLFENLSPQTNRIHADDLAQICIAAATTKAHGQIYNVSDGTNSNMTEYFNTIADFCGLPRPPLVDWPEAEKTISKGMLSYLKESRRMDNTKLINELNIKLLYPTLKEGLKSCVN